MIAEPQRYLRAFREAGADVLTIHAEAVEDPRAVLEEIRKQEMAACLAVNPDTPLAGIEACLDVCDLALVMSVNPGFSGGKFVPESFARVAEIRQRLDALGSSAWLEVDGGVNAENLPKLKEAGATAFVAATAVFKHPEGIATGLQALRSSN